MHRAFSFPGTVERSQTKERLEASLVGLCELDLRKQRQEALVLGALALGEPPGAEAASFSSRRQENVTLSGQLVRSLRVRSFQHGTLKDSITAATEPPDLCCGCELRAEGRGWSSVGVEQRRRGHRPNG